MFNDNLIRVPINGTAATVASQKNCVDELTPHQEHESILDRINQIEQELLSLPKKDEKRKRLGVIKFELQEMLSPLKVKMKVVNITASKRYDFTDCVFEVMRNRLSAFQYKSIMSSAKDMYKENQDKIISDDKQHEQ